MKVNQSKILEHLIRIESKLLGQKSVFSFNEVVEYTGLSKSYLYKLSSTGGIPCYKPKGKLIFFKRDEIDNWLLQNRKRTNVEIEAEAATKVALNIKSTL